MSSFVQTASLLLLAAGGIYAAYLTQVIAHDADALFQCMITTYDPSFSESVALSVATAP